MVKERKREPAITLFVDGGSRGNPGPAACAAVIEDANRGEIKTYSLHLGVRTNNEAEYEAVLLGLKKIRALYGKKKIKKLSLEVRCDSELIVMQLNGKYKILDKKIQPLFLETWNTRLDFGKVLFCHVPRLQNKKADMLVNRELDAKSSSLFPLENF